MRVMYHHAAILRGSRRWWILVLASRLPMTSRYIDVSVAGLVGNELGDRIDNWTVIWGREMYSLREFINLCEKRRYRGKTTKLLTFVGIVEPTSRNDLYTATTNSLRAAQKLVENKRVQSAKAAARNAPKGRGKGKASSVAAPKTPPKAAPVLQAAPSTEPEQARVIACGEHEPDWSIRPSPDAYCQAATHGTITFIECTTESSTEGTGKASARRP